MFFYLVKPTLVKYLRAFQGSTDHKINYIFYVVSKKGPSKTDNFRHKKANIALKKAIVLYLCFWKGQ